MTYSECVYLALVVLYIKRMSRIVLLSVSCVTYRIFPQYLMNGMIYFFFGGGGIIEHIRHILISSTIFFSGTFLTLRRTERGIVINKRKYPLFLSDFN